MKKIWNMIRLDTRLVFRDKIMIYLVLAPMIMAAIIMVVLSFVSDATPTLYVTGNIPEDTISRLKAVAYIQEEKDLAALTYRVNAFDNMAGVYYDNGTVHIMLQGNESSAFEEEITTLVNNALMVDTPGFVYTDLSVGHNWLARIIMSALLISPAFIGGVVSGFNLVTEKEIKMNRGYRISPLGYGSLLTSRCVFAVLIGLIVLALVALVIGVSPALPLILLATVFALPIFAAMPIVIGFFANDKMGAITLFKVLMMVFLILPVSSEFVPESLNFLYWPFPMYWQYQTMLGVLDSNFSIFNAIMTFLTGATALGLFALFLGTKTNKTVGG